jgi:hypothetical protein
MWELGKAADPDTLPGRDKSVDLDIENEPLVPVSRFSYIMAITPLLIQQGTSRLCHES